MGSVVMPKNSADIEVLIPILEYYYNNQNWIDNANYIEYIKQYLLEKGIDTKEREPQHYTKRMQILSYFGFIEWEDINNSQSARRITKSGRQFYKAIKDNDQSMIAESIITALENTTFGRMNTGAPNSESDIEAPCLCIRLILELNYITKTEFAYCLYKLQDKGFTYSTILQEIKDGRDGTIEYTLPEEANKYTDWKPINFLERFHILKTEESETFLEPSIKSNYIDRLRNLKVYSIDKDIKPSPNTGAISSIDDELLLKKGITDSSATKHTNPKQIIYYGVPGCGKSHKISEMLSDKEQFQIVSEENQIIRTVFHPDYTNADFIGQILPEVNDSRIEYNFKAGPFAEILARALIHPENQYVLIIEEINRGNSAAIFGEIFQLLDRIEVGETTCEDGLNKYGKGWSEYFFMNDYINYYVRQSACNSKDPEKIVKLNGIEFSDNTGIRLPPNLSLLATMNTSDQNVFTLDNAFQRRWNMEYISNKFDINAKTSTDKQKNQFNATIGETQISWGKFRDAINKEIANPENSFANAEDKQLGLFFIKAENKKINESDFSNKVLKYLWNDVFKRDKSIFNDNVLTFGDLLDAFKGSDAFIKSFSTDFIPKLSE